MIHQLNMSPWMTVCSHLPPLWSSRLGSGPQSSDGVPLLLLGQKVQRHLQANGLHVILTERWRHVHVHLQEATWKTTEVNKSSSPPLPSLYTSVLFHLLAPRQPGPSPVWSVNWQTIQMTSGLCWSRWSRPAGSKTDSCPHQTHFITPQHNERWLSLCGIFLLCVTSCRCL